MSKVKRTLKYIATAGQSEKLREAGIEFEARRHELSELLGVCQTTEASLKMSLTQLGESKKRLVQGLSSASKLLCRASNQDLALIRRETPVDLLNEAEVSKTGSTLTPNKPQVFAIHTVMDTTVDQFNIAVSATKGSMAGVAIGMGSWPLVSAFGTASTGTAISTLSGIAAHNATLAWFGGGALAAGGGGMAAGALVFGGMITIPAILVAIGLGYKKTKKQVKDLEQCCTQLNDVIKQCKEYLATIKSATEKAQSVSSELVQNGRVFFSALDVLRHQIYPVFFLSAAWRWLRRLVTGRYFHDEEIAGIVCVCQSAMNVIVSIDIPIFPAV